MCGSLLIEFKKAFGITSVPVEFLVLATQLASHEFPVKSHGVLYTIRLGSFGGTREEHTMLGGFLHSDERNSFFEHPFKLSTLDVVFDWNLSDSLSIRALEGKLRALRSRAHAALENLIRSWMQTEKNRHRLISEDEMFAILRRIPRISLTEFQNGLFYRAHTAAGPRAGFIGEGSIITSTPMSDSVRKEIIHRLELKPSQFDEQLLDAWLNYYDEDFSNSLLKAAFACEILTKSFLCDQLNQSGISSKTTKEFVRWLPMRDMFRVVLPLYFKQKGHRGLLGGCVKIFQERNDIAHGIKQHVRREEAWYALSRTEKLAKLLR
jgi:hypothetical protein